MKFTSAFTTLALTLAAVTSSAEARIGHHQKYTIFFSNPCSNPVPVEAFGRAQTIPAHSCHPFQHGKQYPNSVQYREWKSPQFGERIHCSQIGHHAYCNEAGLPDQACVIRIEHCFAPQGAAPTNTGTFLDDDETGAVAAPTNTGTFTDDDHRNLSADDTPADATLTGTMTGTYADNVNASHPNLLCPGSQPNNDVYCRSPTDYLKQKELQGHSGLSCPFTDDYGRTTMCDCLFKNPYWECGPN